MSAELCPIHRVPLVLSYRGVKTVPDLHARLEGLPMLYCPMCAAEGKDTAREFESARTNAFVAGLRRLLEKTDFSPHFHKPEMTFNFNPHKARLEQSGLGERKSSPSSFQTLDEDIAKRLDLFVPHKPLYSLDRLILDDATRKALHEVLALIEQQYLIYETWNLQSIDRSGRKVALNFYGLPGTGKTLAAEALANFLGRDILMVSYAELESKYVGETPKNIKAAFAKASRTGAVLFFDEADSILGKRLTNVQQSADHSVNLTRSTTLIELDRFNGLVIFASNLVSNYDTAFLRRMIAHIEFRLPEKPQLRDIWRVHLPPQLPVEPNLDFDKLAEISLGASGGEVKNAVLLAAAKVATRPKSEQVVRFADFAEAITSILEQKQRVLNSHQSLLPQ
ncbi:MAG: ATP-binding protein [Chloroherpetonaceae bacterium]|nr:ATP-binding protein [Chloroherpetonaceae bacterium]MCS7212003.1 ATP-binding protein [Chloroherpetonaceae bacterium]MDW8019129.1 ATP-binding protein [Chloroherpetonaceae bacterium]MDW8466926.1 ATP-binding protein [Chloroherpetonaceae bacterium]